MSTKIHPTAVVDSKAKIAEGVEIGPYVVVEGNVSIGKGTVVAPHAVLQGHVEIGEDNKIGVGAVIGLEPQDLAYKGGTSSVKIGNKNVIREYAQIHRGTKDGTATVIGDHNFLMGFSHCAHNVKVGNHVIVANGALLAGYVQVDDFAFISGLCLIHQFTRVGKYAMMRGGAAISLDLAPYCVADENNWARGINTVGLERRGFTTDQIRGIKKTYKNVFGGERPMADVVKEALSSEGLTPEIRYFLEFIQQSERGVCRPQS